MTTQFLNLGYIMQQTIFIVYVTYGVTVENLFAFNLQLLA